MSKSPLTDDPVLDDDDEPISLEEMWDNYDITREMEDEPWTDEDEEGFWGGPTPERP